MKKFANVALFVTLVFAPAQANMGIEPVERVAHTAQVEAQTQMFSVNTASSIGSVPGK